MIIDLAIDKILIPLNANVIWKLEKTQMKEYGLMITKVDFKTSNMLKQGIKLLKNEYEDNIDRLKDM